MLKIHSIRPVVNGEWLRSFRAHPLPCHQAVSFLGGENFSYMDSTQKQILARLHQTLPYDSRAQVLIDAHLPCAFLSDAGIRRRHPSASSRHLILGPGDAPQFGNLPDVCPIIRSVLLAGAGMGVSHGKEARVRGVSRDAHGQRKGRGGASESTPLLHACIRQCIFGGDRRLKAPVGVTPDTQSVAVLLNMLLATLLGLYPACQRRPFFATRCELYKRVHHLLTSDEATLARFVVETPALLGLALSEYIYNVVPACMPVEAEFLLLSAQKAQDPLPETCAQVLDAFRRGGVDDGCESWEAYNAHAQKALDQCNRLFPMRLAVCADTPPPPTLSPVAASVRTGERVRAALDMRPGATSGFAARVQGVVQRHVLPENLTAMQVEKVRRMAVRCEYKARQRSTLLVCVACELCGHSASFRTDAETLQTTCSDRCDGCVVAVNALGSVLTVRGRTYVFAPCCERIVEYTEEHGAVMWTGGEGGLVCPVGGEVAVAPPRAVQAKRYTCKFCSLPSKTLVPYEYPSLREHRMVSTYLCGKHAPNEALLRYIYNQEDFEEVCEQFVAQVKPWYRRVKPRPGRR